MFFRRFQKFLCLHNIYENYDLCKQIKLCITNPKLFVKSLSLDFIYELPLKLWCIALDKKTPQSTLFSFTSYFETVLEHVAKHQEQLQDCNLGAALRMGTYL